MPEQGNDQVWAQSAPLPVDLALSPDGRLCAVPAGFETISLIRISDGRTERQLKGHQAACLAFSPDGSRLASGGYDYAIGLWNVQSSERLAVLEGHEKTVGDVPSAEAELPAVIGMAKAAQLMHSAWPEILHGLNIDG